VKKLLAAGALGLLLAGGTVTAAIAAPDANGPAKHGLCTAYFNGSETGQAHKRQAGPFQALEQAADDGDSNTSPAQDVANFCDGLIGGRAGGDKGTPGKPQ
jgi:hypothetical protein